MVLLEKLAETTKRQHDEGDLPACLVEEILALCADTTLTREMTDLLGVLLRQVEDFDSYAGAGCFGDSASAATIAATLNHLRGRS